MTNAYVMMGNPNSKKSSTIRALTGIPSKGTYQISAINGVIDVYINISSLQESKISPQIYINEVNSNNYNNVLIGLWIRNSRNLPSGKKYIDDFMKAGWNIPHIAVLDSSLPNLPKGCIAKLIRSDNRPANEIASDIRKMWNWI